MSLTHPTHSPHPTDNAVGFVANLFRGTACIEEAFHQEGREHELQYLEKCWSDSAVLQFILLGWIGIALKTLLFVLLATFLAACVQGRRPWYVFVSVVKGVGRVVGGICSCCEIDDEEGVGERMEEAEKGLGIVWQDEKEGGGYFGSPKEKVLVESLKQSLTTVLTLMKDLTQQEAEEREVQGRRTTLARKEALRRIDEKDKEGVMSMTDHGRQDALQFASEMEMEGWYKSGGGPTKDDWRQLQVYCRS